MHKKAVKTYIDALQNLGIVTDISVESSVFDKIIDCVSYDNRKLNGNSIFVCKGANFKNEYAHNAVEKGAVLCVSDHIIEGITSYVIVNDLRKAIVEIAKHHYDNPQDKVQTIGITGTKGKGCVLYFLQSIMNCWLESLNKPKCAIVSSIRTYDGVQDYESHLTTPETFELYENFYNAWQSGIKYLIMEVSSLGLKFGRTNGIKFDVSCFTNFGKDHVSDIEHPDIQDYFVSKLKIFDTSKAACINLDSDRAPEVFAYAKSRCDITTFSSNEIADITCSNIVSSKGKISFDVKTPKFSSKVCLSTSGIFNVSNAMAAISIAINLGVPKDCILTGLSSAKIPGRMITFTSYDEKLAIVVDYAHNKMSFEALFNSLSSEYNGWDICAAFGAPGDKSYERRIDLPQVASQFCKQIVICEDDPASENFIDIAHELEKSISISNYSIVENRKEAVEYIIDSWDGAKPLVIALAGKGDERYMRRGNDYVETPSDVDIAKSIIKQYNSTIEI